MPCCCARSLSSLRARRAGQDSSARASNSSSIYLSAQPYPRSDGRSPMQQRCEPWPVGPAAGKPQQLAEIAQTAVSIGTCSWKFASNSVLPSTPTWEMDVCLPCSEEATQLPILRAGLVLCRKCPSVTFAGKEIYSSNGQFIACCEKENTQGPSSHPAMASSSHAREWRYQSNRIQVSTLLTWASSEC